MQCAYHPGNDAVGACVDCGRFICAECKTMLGEKIHCNPCVEKMYASKTTAGTRLMENTSGQGELAEIPPEISGWNWGAFLLSWIWGIGNSVWIALLCLIPCVGFVMAFVLGAKGNEWAWRKKEWNSIEHFKRTQRTWAWWGLGLWGFFTVIYIILIIIGAFAGGNEFYY